MSEEDSWEQLDEEVITCRICPRLVEWREQVAREKRRAYRDWDYWGKPVPGFGDRQGRVFIVGLAPGAHGSNRTGRMFTGDGSGEILFKTLHKTGFSNQPLASERNDGLELNELFITAVARCAPPANKPTTQEMAACRPFLEREWQLMPQITVIIALGGVAFNGCRRLLRDNGYSLPRMKFGHGLHYRLENPSDGRLINLITSYHPSRQNTQTGRLTPEMLENVFNLAHSLLGC